METKSISIKSKWLIPCKDYKLHGKVLSWRDNGNKWSEEEYKNGKLHGKRIRWYNNGDKWYEMEFKNNKLIK